MDTPAMGRIRDEAAQVLGQDHSCHDLAYTVNEVARQEAGIVVLDQPLQAAMTDRGLEGSVQGAGFHRRLSSVPG